MLHRIVGILLQYGPLGVFFLGFADSLGIPLPAAMDGLIILMGIKAPQHVYLTALMALLGSVAGNCTLFLAARYGHRKLIRQAEPERPQRFRKWFERYGLLTVFVPAVTPIIPIPLKVFVVSAAAFRTPFRRFLLVILVARIIRYFGQAYLAVRLGADTEGFLARNAWPLVGCVIALAFVLYLAIRLSDRQRPSAA